jgi:hypothetical protein
MLNKFWLVGLVAATSIQLAQALNLSTSTAGIQYAHETVSDASSIAGVNDNVNSVYLNIADSAAGSLDLKGNLGLAGGLYGTGSEFYVRFDLENAAFSAAVGGTDLSITTVGASDRVSKGGAQGESFVIFHITSGASNLVSDVFTFPLAGVAILSIGGEAVKQASANFGVYGTFTDAIAKRDKLSGTSRVYVNLVDGIKVDASQENLQADGAASFKKYVVSRGTNATGTFGSLGSLEIGSAHVDGSNIIYDQDGTTHIIADSITNFTAIEISGNFSNGTYYLDSNLGCPLAATTPPTLPTTTAAGKLTISSDKKLATQTLAVLNTNPSLCHVPDGETQIPASTYSTMITYSMATGSGTHADELAALGSVTLFGLTEEQKNKDSDGDGVADLKDVFPNDATESVDTDSD